jgi:hypothetical protein
LLHHSEDEDRLVLGATSYFDDSGTHDQSPLVVIGGPVFTRIKFKEFSKRWAKMLKDRRIEPPLHMTDFVALGKHASMAPEFKRELFIAAARIINDLKFYSVAVMVSRDDFEAELSKEVKKNLIGPYAFAFFSAVLSNLSAIGQSKLFEGKISYLVDLGSAFPEQLRAAHALIVKAQQGTPGEARIGAFAQDTDTNVAALQAADAIAWSTRRRHLDGGLPEGFEPLNAVLDERLHVSVLMPKGSIAMIAAPINAWITKHGSIPKLSDVMAAEQGGRASSVAPPTAPPKPAE